MARALEEVHLVSLGFQWLQVVGDVLQLLLQVTTLPVFMERGSFPVFYFFFEFHFICVNIATTVNNKTSYHVGGSQTQQFTLTCIKVTYTCTAPIPMYNLPTKRFCQLMHLTLNFSLEFAFMAHKHLLLCHLSMYFWGWLLFDWTD